MIVLTDGPGAVVLNGGEDMNEKDDMVPNPDVDDEQAEDALTNPRLVTASIDWAVYKKSAEGVTVDLEDKHGYWW